MPQAAATLSCRVLAFGLDRALRRQLCDALPELKLETVSEVSHDLTALAEALQQRQASLIFAGAAGVAIDQLLALARSANVPVVIVSRNADTSQWLDAIEAGAADYAAPPFEPCHLRWILEANLGHKRSASEPQQTRQAMQPASAGAGSAPR